MKNRPKPIYFKLDHKHNFYSKEKNIWFIFTWSWPFLWYGHFKFFIIISHLLLIRGGLKMPVLNLTAMVHTLDVYLLIISESKTFWPYFLMNMLKICWNIAFKLIWTRGISWYDPIFSIECIFRITTEFPSVSFNSNLLPLYSYFPSNYISILINIFFILIKTKLENMICSN